jgi:undecaprenyl-diphosphooligosaccharide---protein glycotransferase
MKIKLFEYKNNVWLFGAVLLGVFAVSTWTRYQQFATWEKTPGVYFVGERPMMTTLDAPHWLRVAREYNDGVFRQKNGLRQYPERTDDFREQGVPEKYRDVLEGKDIDMGLMVMTYRDVPLLSYLIAHLAPFFNFNYYLAGTLLIPLFASLFILPLGIYFFWIGVPLSGLLGGLVGTFAGGYYMRSAIGRIDTDMLNLFFPVIAGLLIFLAGRAKTERSVLFYAVGAGLSLFLFQWWYGKAGFTLVYFALLVFHLFLQRVSLRTIILSAFLFVLCVQPSTYMDGTRNIQSFVKGYFSIEETRKAAIGNTIQATFPNTMNTISEVAHVTMSEVLRRVLSNTTMGWIGLLGFFSLTVFKWRVLLPLVPILALGLLSFQSSNRFIMYLAPFIGIGLGWLINIFINYIFYFSTSKGTIVHKINGDGINRERRKEKGGNIPEVEIEATTYRYINLGRQIVLYFGMGVFFWLISGQTAISFVPGPSINTRLYATFLEVKKRIPDNAALLTWWDYGYAITDATGLATFHDGSSQQSPKTYFIARGLISEDQDELYDITQYLATEGNRGISENNTSPEALLTAVRDPQLKPWDPIYLFFTADMTGKYGAISKLGSWDIVNGGSKPRGYQNLSCNKITNDEMNCRGAKIDLKAGKINNQVALKRMVFIRDGQVLREQKFEHAQGYTLQLLVAGQQIVEVQLIDEVVFRSNYNQMFLLGKYREDLYEETYNAFPFSRLYRVKF